MTTPQTSVQTYDELLDAIRKVQSASRKRVEQAINQEKIREAWETGKLIDAHVLQFKERADYGHEVLKRLARDLGTSDTELGFCLQFVRAYPIYPHAGKLTWSDYRDLLSLNDPEDRSEVEALAVRGNWNRDELREEIRKRQSRVTAEPSRLEVLQPGKINTYRVVKAAAGPYTGRLGLDLGFSNYFQPDGISQFKENDIVTFENGRLKKIEAEEAMLFTYNAYVTEVIDADTFHALVDLGFKIVTEQKLRLRGLDAPPVESADGREAKAFLQKQLPASGTPVLIRTTKSDKYDRYLADVWVGPKWLNQELVESGYALKLGSAG